MFNEKFRRPNISFTEMLKKGAAGQYRERGEYTQFMFRALVIACDTEGGKLESPSGEPIGDKLEVKVYDNTGANLLAQYPVDPTTGPYNPKNSVRARIVSNNMDQIIDDDNLRTFWPMFPGADSPSAGELVYVVFEDEAMKHGLWLAKVPYPEEPLDSVENAGSRYVKPHTKNQILMSDILSSAATSKKTLFPDTPPEPTAADPSPLKKRQRLSELFIG